MMLRRNAQVVPERAPELPEYGDTGYPVKSEWLRDCHINVSHGLIEWPESPGVSNPIRDRMDSLS